MPVIRRGQETGRVLLRERWEQNKVRGGRRVTMLLHRLSLNLHQERHDDTVVPGTGQYTRLNLPNEPG